MIMRLFFTYKPQYWDIDYALGCQDVENLEPYIPPSNYQPLILHIPYWTQHPKNKFNICLFIYEVLYTVKLQPKRYEYT